MTEYERMQRGFIYDALSEELTKEIERSRQLCLDFNRTDIKDKEKRDEILKELLCLSELNGYCTMEIPIVIDNGKELKIGRNFYANSYFTVIGGCPIEIGDNVFIGPHCTLATGLHSFIPEQREIKPDKNGILHDYEYGKPIKIGSNVWIASNVTICAGVTVGDNVVIGAGSVVTRDIPDGVIAFGNPCRVQREINDKDNMYLATRRG